MSKKVDPAERSAQISFQVREALRQALPAPAEQFFTVMVPGKVVNFSDYTEGFDQDGKQTGPILPAVTELNQAILCDDMPVLAPVQLGPTGRSVARSYDAAISKLVPAGTTVGVDPADATNLTEDESRYRRAMDWLTFRDREQGGQKSRVEIYAEKQSKYTKAVESKTKAFDEALQRAKNDPGNLSRTEQRAAYDRWVTDNARTYRNFIQAAYMDWIVSGNKEEVEYYFSIVDRDSAMARVEASKEAMRAAVVQDSDGSVEYQKVRLTPANWAVIAERKAVGNTNSTRTAEWYTWEITRLTKMNTLLKALKDRKPVTVSPDPAAVDDKGVTGAMTDYIDKRNAYYRALSDTKKTDAEKATAETEYGAAKTKLETEQKKYKEDNIKDVNSLNQKNQDEMYNLLQGETGMASGILAANDAKITEYKTARADLLKKHGADSLLGEIADGAGVKEKEAESETKKEVDYFTAISIEISSSSSTKSQSASKTAASYGASVGWGWWSASASGSMDSSTAAASEAMSNSNCKISFECMRVDIQRSWLRPELFYDSDLTTGPNEFISPGFGRLRDLMEKKAGDQKELDRYSTFPLYPTAFLLATNVILEISGESTAIQSHFQQSSSQHSASFNYGPFSVISAKASHSSSSQSSDSSCEATSEGCRITIKSPQIIGWISQMVPALPRLKDDAPPPAKSG